MGRYSFRNEIMKTFCLNLLDFVWFHLISFNYFEHNPINDIINSFRWCQKFLLYISQSRLHYVYKKLFDRENAVQVLFKLGPIIKKKSRVF